MALEMSRIHSNLTQCTTNWDGLKVVAKGVGQTSMPKRHNGLCRETDDMDKKQTYETCRGP